MASGPAPTPVYSLIAVLSLLSKGLGLVRLLQDAKRFEEARTTLSSLEHGFQGIAQDKESQNPCKANRLKGVSKSHSFTARSAKHECVQRTK